MKFYLASGIDNAVAAELLAQQISQRCPEWEGNATWFNKQRAFNSNEAAKIALTCFSEIREADVFILFGTNKTRGRWIEFGFAIALNKPISMLFEKGSVPAACYLPHIAWADSIEGVVNHLSKFDPETKKWQ